MAGHRNSGKGLGKGLDSLFGEESHEENGVKSIKLREIEPNPSQPRQSFGEAELAELAESIRENGIITPLTLRKSENGYEIIAGERRWRACRMAGLETVPALVLDADDKRAFELAMIENLQREDLNPIEEAEGYRELIERFEFTQEKVADKMGKSRPTITNAIRLLSLPQSVIEFVREGKLSMGHARALLGAKKAETIIDAANLVIEHELSVRETERLVKKLEEQENDEKPKKDDVTMMYIEELEHRLASLTGRKIAISQGKNKGKISIEYYGNEDLEEISNVIMKINSKK